MANGLPSVPKIDLSSFTSGRDFESRNRAARELAKKAHKNGSVRITGHGVPPEMLEKAFQISKKLFVLSYEDKMKAPHPAGFVPHRGYSGLGKEQGGAKTASEIWRRRESRTHESEGPQSKPNSTDPSGLESYEIGSEENEIQYNIWLPKDVLPDFRSFMTGFYWFLNKSAMAVLEAIIMSLNLTENEAESVRKLHTGHDNQLRLLHYPPVSSKMLKDEEVGRLAAHTDSNTFTLLWQDEHSGLEFGDRETGELMPAIAKEGVMYMNMGDVGQRLSNGFYPSALHRVIIPVKGEGEGTSARYSIPFFVAPFPEGLVEPQPSLFFSDGKQVYEPMTFGAYRDMMMKITQAVTDN